MGIKGSEILEVLHQTEDVKKYLFSLYNCQYADFFQELGKVEQILKADRYLFPHYAFGVTEEFMDSELCRFIASGRLHAKIDKVGGIVITNRPDNKNTQYQSCIKQGDLLLNRVQKLSRVISI